jgi:hypothetical protein
MARAHAYAILGHGRWAEKIQQLLCSEGRHVSSVDRARKFEAETDADYLERLRSALKRSRAQIAWLCVPPGPHVAPMVDAALEAGLSVIAEKPWLCSPAETSGLLAKSRIHKLQVGIDYEYCLLEAVEVWQQTLHGASGLQFGGEFHISRPNHLGISAMDNLGTHLLAMRAYAAPESTLAEINCSYGQRDERRAWLKNGQGATDAIDFLANREPILQRFVEKFESALDGEPLVCDLDFALKVAAEADKLR